MRKRKKAIDYYGMRYNDQDSSQKPYVHYVHTLFRTIHLSGINAMAARVDWVVCPMCLNINTDSTYCVCSISCLCFNVLAKDRKIDNNIKSKVLFSADYNIVNDVLINIKQYSVGVLY